MLKCISMQNWMCESRLMTILTKKPPRAEMMLAKPLHRFANYWLDNVNINMHANVIQIYYAFKEL